MALELGQRVSAAGPAPVMGSLKTVWMRGDGNFQGEAPEARCGHVAACIKNHAAWGDEFIVIHGRFWRLEGMDWREHGRAPSPRHTWTD